MSTVLYTTDEAATRTRLAKQTLARLRVSGGGPEFIRLGAKVLYPAPELEAWIATKPLMKSTADGTTRRPNAGRPRPDDSPPSRRAKRAHPRTGERPR